MNINMMSMVDDWTMFSVLVVCGVSAVVCIFEGARRLGSGTGRGAGVMLFFGELFCLTWGGLAFWDHWTYEQDLAILQAPIARELPADFAKLPPDKQEKLSFARARGLYLDRGALVTYVNRAAEVKPFVPAPDDMKHREAATEKRARLTQDSRARFADALQWWSWCLLAAVLGFLVSVDTPRPPPRAEE